MKVRGDTFMQKKGLCFILILFASLIFSSCFTSKIYPNMVEYSKEKVLDIAKEKYQIQSFIFDDQKLHNHYATKEEFMNSALRFVNPDNLEVCFSSFAGKNGGHDIQGMYSNFVAYYALGITQNNEAKFIFYNVNLDKDANIIDTIGCSDYPYDVLPNEIPKDMTTLFAPIPYDKLRIELFQKFQSIAIYELRYTEQRLSIQYREYKYMEFYKEDGNLVYDYYTYDSNRKEWILKYSSSPCYGILYKEYGKDDSALFDISYSIQEYDKGLDRLEAKVQIKEKSIPGEILYSNFNTRISYKIFKDSKVYDYEDTIRSEKTLEHSCLIQKIDGITHQDTTTVLVSDYYILYSIS